MWWNVLSLKIWLLKIYRQICWSANLCSWFLWTVSVGLAYIFLFLFSYLSSLQSFYPLLAIPTNTVAKMKLLLLKCRRVFCSDVSHNMLFYFYFDFFKNPHRVLWPGMGKQWHSVTSEKLFLNVVRVWWKWNRGFLFWKRGACSCSLPI